MLQMIWGLPLRRSWLLVSLMLVMLTIALLEIHGFFIIVGITITGLESPLIVGGSATISCIINEHASLIVWSRQSYQLNMDVNVTVLNYTIPLISDDLQGETFTCTAVVSNTNDTESVMLSVAGIILSIPHCDV